MISVSSISAEEAYAQAVDAAMRQRGGGEIQEPPEFLCFEHFFFSDECRRLRWLLAATGEKILVRESGMHGSVIGDLYLTSSGFEFDGKGSSRYKDGEYKQGLHPVTVWVAMEILSAAVRDAAHEVAMVEAIRAKGLSLAQRVLNRRGTQIQFAASNTGK